MKRIISLAAGACFTLGLAAAAMAQDPPTHSETTTTKTGAGPNTEVKQETVTGMVKEYEPGEKIKIVGPGDKDYTFDLEEASRVEGSIAVGQPAKVMYRKSDDGREVVIVLSAGGASGAAAPPAPRAYSESTVKQTGPGPNVKTKSEVVIGTVKDFEPGKKIKIVGPGDKDYTFDLDDTAVMQSGVAVGQRVKVTYTKTSTGGRVASIEPYSGS